MPAQSTYTPIQTITAANSNSSDYIFNNIPATYTDLVVVCNVRGAAAQSTQQFAMYLGDASNLFQSTQNSTTNLFGDGSSAGASRTSNASGLFQYGGMVGGSTTANLTSTFVFHIFSYANTNTFKSILSQTANDRAGATSTIAAQVSMVRTTTAITRVGLASYGDGNFATGSTFTLYGILAA